MNGAFPGAALVVVPLVPRPGIPVPLLLAEKTHRALSLEIRWVPTRDPISGFNCADLLFLRLFTVFCVNEDSHRLSVAPQLLPSPTHIARSGHVHSPQMAKFSIEITIY